MAQQRKPRKLLIAIPIFEKMMATDAICPYDVLQFVPGVEIVFVSHKPGPYADARGYLSINATASFEDVPNPDIIVVPGGMGVLKMVEDRPLLDWLQKVHKQTLYTTSVCTGSILLGAAGVLTGLNATTHWASMEKLAKYGAIPTSQRVVQAGKVITAAGVSAGIDMALKLAAIISSETQAKLVQLVIEYDPQPPFDCGSVEKAGPEILEKAQAFLNESRREAMTS